MRDFGRRPGGGFRGSPSPFGGGMGGLRIGPGGPVPPVVKWLLISNFAVFLLPMLPGIDNSLLREWFALVPTEVFAGGRIWQLVTYMFLHGGIAHVGLNMFMLWMFGTLIERAWGSQPFLVYYLVCGVGGALVTWATGPGSYTIALGASAAVLGLLVAFAMMDPDRKLLFWFVIPVKVKWVIWLIIIGSLIGAFDGYEDNIAHFAHLGGMLAGYLYLKQDWRLGSFGRRVRGASARRKMEQNARRTESVHRARDEQMREVNRILEKINREGMESLTPEEHRILREASGR